ncbi:MAG: hypothetical protein Q8O03_07520 [Nanoarchaeota archaeon]|nr:hypothetical protein [Nanoarchaeota archaeon]
MKNNQLGWEKKLEDILVYAGEETKREYSFEKQEGENTYSYTVIVSKVKKPKDKNKIVELTELVQGMEGLRSFERPREKSKRVSELVKELALEYKYEFERTVWPDYHIYTRRIGDVCDVLMDCSGKIAYTQLDLRKPLKNHFYENTMKILPQKKEVKKFGKAFWAVEENFFLGTLGQRLLSYSAVFIMGGIVGFTYSFGSPGLFFKSVLYGGAGSFLALGCSLVDYYCYKRKTKKAFERYDSKIVYNKEALEKALGNSVG